MTESVFSGFITCGCVSAWFKSSPADSTNRMEVADPEWGRRSVDEVESALQSHEAHIYLVVNFSSSLFVRGLLCPLRHVPTSQGSKIQRGV